MRNFCAHGISAGTGVFEIVRRLAPGFASMAQTASGLHPRGFRDALLERSVRARIRDDFEFGERKCAF